MQKLEDEDLSDGKLRGMLPANAGGDAIMVKQCWLNEGGPKNSFCLLDLFSWDLQHKV